MTAASQVVVITGASAGLGRAIVQRFAERGARIGLIARGLDRLEATKKEVEARGGQALVLPADVADADAIDAAAQRVESELGPIDVWINNAMASVYAPVLNMQADEYRRVTEVTYLGYVHGTLSALKRMRPRNRGVIIQVGSALAYRSIPLQSAYCAAKHAVKGFTESLLTELIHDRIDVRVTMVHMPALNTPQFEWTRNRMPNRAQPVPPIYQPELGAAAVMHAVDHDVGREFLVGGPTVKAVIGEKLVPGYIDRYLARHGYAAAQTNEPAQQRLDNLWKPVPGDWGAHGRFDDVARARSAQLFANMHRRWLVLGVLAMTVAAMAVCY